MNGSGAARRARIVGAGRSLGIAAVLAALSAWTCGCVVCWGILNADGSGMFEINYGPPPGATPESVKAQFQSPHVKVESAAITPEGRAVVRATFDDITQISSAPMLGAVSIARARIGREERLSIVLHHSRADADDTGREGPRISITLPGKIIEANKNAEITGNRVVWRYTLNEFNRESPRELTVRYAAPRG